MNKPKVKSVAGKVNKNRSGLIKILKAPMTTTIDMSGQEPLNLIPGIKLAVR